MNRSVANIGRRVLAIALGTLLLAPIEMPAVSAQPTTVTGPPVCSTEHPEFCPEPDPEVTLLAGGRWGNGQSATLSLSPLLDPCYEGSSTGCYNQILPPEVDSCYEASYSEDGHRFVPCAWYVVDQFQQALDGRGAMVSPGGKCSGEFRYGFSRGGPLNDPYGPWDQGAPQKLDCTVSWTSLGGTAYLNSETYVSFRWGVRKCFGVGPRELGAGSECNDSEGYYATAGWIEVLGNVYDSEPVAKCTLAQREAGSRIIRPVDESFTIGPNPSTKLGSTFEIPRGLDWSSDGRSLIADSPGLHTVTITTEIFGWSRTDSATCQATVDPWDDDDSGDGDGSTECDGRQITVYLANGDSATVGDDVILGTPGDDMIYGFDGDDTICAGEGNDVVVGGNGDDTIFGEAGGDVLRGGPGMDEVHGGDGNDRVLGGIGNDTMTGGEGNDYMGGFGGADRIDGGPGNERIFGGFGADTIDGGPGNDVISGLIGNDIINGGPGDDTLNGDSGLDTINGNGGNDTINGGNANDILNGNGGNDSVNGGRADDQLSGGAGNDDTCVGNKEHVADTADDTCERIFGVP